MQVNISSTDISKSLIRNSLKVYNILTRQIDICKFTLKKYGSTHTYSPVVGEVVQVYDGVTKIFEGNITKINQRSRDYKIILFDIEAHDYGRQLDRFLINDSFENQTIEDIIDFIIADKGLDTEGFTTNNVVGPKVVAYIAFKYEPMSNVLTQLADLINYDWYVDVDKDIHFFPKEETPASFDVEDDTGSFIWDSLRVRRDNSQVKNTIIVRGGQYLGNTLTSEFKAVNDLISSPNVVEDIVNLPYEYDWLKVMVTGSEFDGGIDGTDDLSRLDYLWNNEEKFIRFRQARLPSDAAPIRVSGAPYLPVIVKMADRDSIATMTAAEGGSSSGIYEHIIIDKSIDSREGARERAQAELNSYAITLSEAEFKTYTSGLRAGQRIRVNSTAHGIDEYFIINKVIYEPWTESAFAYRVSLVSTRTFGIIDFLRGLLTGEKKVITVNENEILDLVEAISEGIAIAEVVVASTSHNPQAESIDVGESTTSQAIDYQVQFVLGPHTWGGEGSGDTKRVFILNGSHLGDFN